MTTSTKETNPKDAVGGKKPPLTTVPMPVLFEVGTAMLEGACKYRRHNYRVVGVRASIYIDAAFRHLAAWWEGEDNDPDSGVNHITKAIAGLIVLRDAMMNARLADDRPPTPDPTWMDRIQTEVNGMLKRHPSPLPPYTNSDRPWKIAAVTEFSKVYEEAKAGDGDDLSRDPYWQGGW